MKKSMLKHTCLIGVMAVSIFLSCDSSEDEVVVPVGWMVDSTWVAIPIDMETQYDAKFTLPEMQEHQNIWNTVKPDRYRYVIEQRCYCSPIIIEYTVDNIANAFSARYLEGTDFDLLKYHPEDSLRIINEFHLDSVFTECMAYFDVSFHSYSGSYHKVFHFPVSYQVDFRENWADDEYGLEITDFWILEEAE